jgi:predicted outer membrane repeat protein
MLNKMVNPDLSGKKQILILGLLLVAVCGFTITINVPADYGTIQAGLNVATEGDSVLVANGIYYENIVWPVVNGIKLIGESEENCIIDGNHSGSVIIFDDGTTDGLIDTTTLIKYFTLQNGAATFDSGGIDLWFASPSLENVTITDNFSHTQGGGILCDFSNPSLENVTITNNISHAIYDGGGGIYCFNSSPSLKHVTISGNFSDGVGGGIALENSSNPSLFDVTITNNSARLYGGGIDCSHSSPSLERVTISGNSAELYRGGGMCLFMDSNPSLKNVTITNNSATEHGGGIDCWDNDFGNADLNLENVTITGNSAEYGGGIAFEQISNASLLNVTITDNSATEDGGGIYCENAELSLVNVTITDNLATEDGGGIYCEDDSNLNCVNCISWNNLPQEVFCDELSGLNSITIAYSDIQGGEEGIVTNGNSTVYWEDGNIDVDPLFYGDGGDFAYYSLTAESPCIDAGTSDLPEGVVLPQFDLIGNPRVAGNSIDMGCYEYQVAGLAYGDIDGNSEVQAYDASLTLRNVVNLYVFNLMQITAADVDGNGAVQALDASLILMYSLGIIDEFPVEGGREYLIPTAEIKIEQCDDELVFTAIGELYSGEIEFSTQEIKVESPFFSEDILSITNTVAHKFKLSFCSATAIIDKEIFRLPIDSSIDELVVNGSTNGKLFNQLVPLKPTQNNDTEEPITKLLGNYPNPFTGETTISFSLTTNLHEKARIEIFNIRGQRVDEIAIGKEQTSVNWQRTNQANGVYFYKLVVDDKAVDTKKMILLK